MIVNERQSQERKRKRLKVASVCILFAGLVSAVTGFWFVVGDHPFHRTDGFAEEFGMSETEVNEYNPRISEWVRHVSDQVGSVSFGWGLFLITLAWLGIRKGQRWAWITLWIGGTPTAIYSTFGELIMFGHRIPVPSCLWWYSASFCSECYYPFVILNDYQQLI